MKCNVGTTDRVLRTILGLVIIALGIAFKSWWGLIGAIPIITAILGWCPMYIPLGISTCKVKEDK